MSDKIHICSQRQLQIMNMSASGTTIIITNCRKCSYSHDYIGNTCSPFTFCTVAVEVGLGRVLVPMFNGSFGRGGQVKL